MPVAVAPKTTNTTNTTSTTNTTDGTVGPVGPRVDAARELLYRKSARSNLLPFCTYTMPSYDLATHLVVLAEALEAVQAGSIKNLIIVAPPRHGKSELVSIRFPTWLMGKDPTCSVVQASYSESLSLKHSRSARNVFVGPEFHSLFPDSHHQPEYQAKGRGPVPVQQAHQWGTTDGGLYYAVGVGGGLTGRGYNFGIVDDPFKDAEQAESTTYREKVWRWWDSVFLTRAEPNAAKILTMARWNEDDLVGRLLKLAKEDPAADQWTVIHMPAISGDNALWPAHYPVEELLRIKASSSSYAWNALWLGSPSSERGNILLKEWWNRYSVPPEMDEVIHSWDMTFKGTGTSMVVGQVWGRNGANKYLLDQVRAKLDFPATVDAFIGLTDKWPQAVAKLVEDAANGPAIIATLKNKIPGIIPIPARGSKAARAQAASPEARAGNVWIPVGPVGDDFIEECAVFPHGLFDDQVDSFSQAMAYWQTPVGKPFMIG